MSDIPDVTSELNQRFRDESEVDRSFRAFRKAYGTKVFWQNLYGGDVYIGTQQRHVGKTTTIPHSGIYLVVNKERKKPEEGGGETEYKISLSYEPENKIGKYSRTYSLPLFSETEDHRGMLCFPDTEGTKIRVRTVEDSAGWDPFIYNEESSSSSQSSDSLSSYSHSDFHTHSWWYFCNCAAHKNIHSIRGGRYCKPCDIITGDDEYGGVTFSGLHDNGLELLVGNYTYTFVHCAPAIKYKESLEEYVQDNGHPPPDEGHYINYECDCHDSPVAVSLPLPGYPHNECPPDRAHWNEMLPLYAEAVKAIERIMVDVCQTYENTEYELVDGEHVGWDGKHLPGMKPTFCSLCAQKVL